MIRLTMLEETDFTWLFIEVRGKKPDRVDLLHLDYPQIAGTKGLVLSCGKVPYWAVTPIASYYRNHCRWQAVYDPEEKGAIVATSSDTAFPVGHFIPLKLPCLICRQEGIEKWLKAGAIYPYCTEHQNHALERQAYQSKRNNREILSCNITPSIFFPCSACMSEIFETSKLSDRSVFE